MPAKYLRFFAVLISLAVGLAIGEVVVRVTGVDWRYLKKNLYYYAPREHRILYVTDPDPEVMFRLKPGAYTDHASSRYYDRYSIHINAQGARGPERSNAKPPNVFRIFCFGGSNVFGDEVDDKDTWPTQLEKRLNEIGPGNIEVWNFGTMCHAGAQSARLAWQSLPYQPDLVIFGLSNMGERAFLKDGPVEEYFVRHPELWTEYLPFWSSLVFGIVPRSGRIWIFDNIRIVRFSIMGFSALPGGLMRKHAWISNWWDFEKINRQRVREFVSRNRGRVPVCFFVGPYAEPNAADSWRLRQLKRLGPLIYNGYWKGLDAPVFHLALDADMPATYAELHPPPAALTWYAARLADWLRQNRLVL
jgi:hypothetical protein